MTSKSEQKMLLRGGIRHFAMLPLQTRKKQDDGDVKTRTWTAKCANVLI